MATPARPSPPPRSPLHLDKSEGEVTVFLHCSEVATQSRRDVLAVESTPCSIYYTEYVESYPTAKSSRKKAAACLQVSAFYKAIEQSNVDDLNHLLNEQGQALSKPDREAIRPRRAQITLLLCGEDWSSVGTTSFVLSEGLKSVSGVS